MWPNFVDHFRNEVTLHSASHQLMVGIIDFLNLLTELGENVNPDDKIFQLKTKFKATQIFKENLEMVMDLLNLIIEDMRNRVQNDVQKIELEKIKLDQLEKQLQLY